MTRHTFRSDTLTLSFVDEGGGEPILLLHGFASSARVNWVDTGWVGFLARAGRRVVALDQRGHGESDKPRDSAAYAASSMAEDARRLLDHLHLERVDVMGYSMGARVAAFLALAHPGRVRSLVFGGLGINMVRGLAGARPIAAALLAPSIADVTNPTARTFRAFADQTGGDRQALAACILGSRVPVPAERVAQLVPPVLVVVGGDDPIGGSAEVLAALIPGAKAVTLPGRDHMKAVGDRGYQEAVRGFLVGRP